MTEPTTIALVRHGQTDWNAERRYQGSSSDTVLNDLGRSQAHEAAAALRQFSAHWDVLRHSPMRRAAETARIIADELHIASTAPLASLTERDWGFGEGRTFAEMVHLFPDLTQYPSEGEANEHYLGAEPLDLVVDRGVFALATMAAQYPGRFVVAATHGTVLRSALEHLFDGDLGYVPNAGVVVLKAWNQDEVLRVELIWRSYEQDTASTNR